jgi:tetratricopeptide (TPR) repeat protein
MAATAPQLSARLQQALAHHQRGELAEAQSLCEEILRNEPQNLTALRFAGLMAIQSGEPQRALNYVDQALALEPDDAPTCYNQGVALERLHRLQQALASYQRALRLRPGYAEAHYNRGNVLRQLDRLEEAVVSYDAAITVRPAHAAAWVNRGNALRNLGQSELALASYAQALALDPTDAEVHCNRGVLLYERNQPGAAIECFQQAITLRPDFAAAFQNRGYAFLLAGDLIDGWADHEWRWKNDALPLGRLQRRFERPLWLGRETLSGQRILLHGEQGLGDTLQFCRYAPLVAALGATVILEVPATLVSLLRSLAGITQVVAGGEPLPPFDYHCPLMSLPLAFGTTLSTVPAEVPYLQSDAGKVRHWKERLGAAGRLRVGLVWSGGLRPNQPQLWYVNRRRNIPLAALAPLRHPQMDFYSLQKGEPAESELTALLACGWQGPRLHDFTAELRDFSDTAALVENLDLILTVDTAAAHLAGALGKPVWIMNRFDGCWRWLLNRSDSPWYPTARLYRQERPGDWAGVVERVRLDLQQLLERRQ